MKLIFSNAFLMVLLFEQASTYYTTSTASTTCTCNALQCTANNQLLCYADENPPKNQSYAKTSAGRVYPTLLSTQTVGKWGSILMQDVYLIEKIQRGNRERIPPRIGHAKGAGAFGYFKVTHDISRYTKAHFLQPGSVTDVVVRFSTQVGEIGSSDTTVDSKGFAVKFYTKEGNYDFVGLNFPVFGHRDAMILPDLLHSRMKNPQTHCQDYNMFWDIASERPETMLFILFFFSQTAFTKSYRYIDGFAIHTFKLVNKKNKPIFAKLTLTSDATDKSYFTAVEALTTAGFNPEYLTKELYDSIASKNYPTWTFNLQVMTAQQAKELPYSIFDATKFWNTTDFPLIPVGKLVLNRNPHNYFNDVEQSAFCPTRLVPGIEPTPDRLLVARMFAYRDAQLYRLGVNHNQLPVNRCPFGSQNYERDGFMNIDPSNNNGPNYFPNTFHGPTSNTDPYYDELPFDECDQVDRIDLKDEDNFSQCRAYLGTLSDDEIQTLLMNMGLSFDGVYPRLIQKVLDRMMDPISKNFGNKFRLVLKNLQAQKAAQQA